MIAKPISIKAAGCRSGDCALKVVELTSGDLPFVLDSGLRRERSFPRSGRKNQLELAFTDESRSEAPRVSAEGTESLAVKRGTESLAIGEQLMEEVCGRENCKPALARVKANRESAGIDGITVQQLPEYLKQHWPAIREQLLSGTYVPQPVKRVEIPKPDGGMRELASRRCWIDSSSSGDAGSATQVDRTFSEHSFGFRSGRPAHQAVEQAQKYIAKGYRWVVDLDLENSSIG